MTLCVDKTRCIGCGMCAAAVPEVFRVVEHVSTVLALPERYREVLLQSVVAGLSDREMAVLWHTTEENIRKIRSRAREKIRKQMEEGEA